MSKATKHPGGRPRKFAEPSTPITVTLPMRTLEELAAIDHDRARAIVRATDMALPDRVPPHRLVEIVKVAENTGLLVVPPSKFLKKIRVMRMVEIAPSRFLLTLPGGTTPSELELAVSDLFETVPDSEVRERTILRELLGHFRRLRRASQLSKTEILLVAL